ncbi:TRAP transporter substrate-binding protein [Solirubrobacter ginsenosidimutans]|uniref:TRAP transporter substrate-binding protein n=1 Tax=Solirubrobacter ginsenosidimutans TaxID=490573 RepID=A0A9X3MT57_9ACTN|nr:TRAP transporter substrate-binding protein [Solirubrobacter ginsenosidimutans]MDA0160758.1 TRAP transporter substrate-binding protein [Solirubrobacter ginsenosidimutans]
MTRAPLLAMLVAAGCGGTAGQPPNKSGAKAAIQPTAIQLESPNGETPYAEHFAKRVGELSGGTLTVYISQRYPSGEAGNEARVARMVRAGELDFAVLPGRTWSSAGAPAFAALQAPFVLTTFDAARRALAGPADALLKADLEHAGVVPLYLAPSDPRRFLTLKPLAGPEAFRGLRIRLYDEATTAASVQALGARPVQGISTGEVYKRLEEGRLDGLETAAGTVISYDYWRAAHNLTAYAMFTGIETLVASSAAWKRLSPSQREVIQAAAEDTARADTRRPAADAEAVESVCSTGMRLKEASVAQLRGFAGATESVRAALRQAPATAAVMRAFEATDGAGPRRLAFPAACAPRPARAPAPRDDAALPEGTYVTRLMPRDYDAGGVGYLGPREGLKWTVRLQDGKWTRTVDPVLPGTVGDYDGAGTYEVRGNEVTFRYTHPRVDASAPEVLRWSYYGGRLSIKEVRVIDGGMSVVYTAHPWRRVR